MKADVEMKAYCLGRHSLSIPATFTISPVVTGSLKLPGASPQDPVIDVVVRLDSATKANFRKIVEERRSELKESNGSTVDVLRYEKNISDEMTMFRVQQIKDAFFSELYFLRGSATVKLRMESFRNNFIEAEEKLLKLSEAILERKPSDEKRTGFCIGPIAFHNELSKENFSFAFRDDKGIQISVDIDTYARDDSVPLPARVSRDSSILKELQVRTEVLRSRERRVAGMSADEWLGVGRFGGEDDFVFKFMLETRRSNPGKTKPSISLSLDSGQPVEDGTRTTTTIERQEALDLWDRIVNSIELAESSNA